MPIQREKILPNTCDTFKLISIKTKADTGNCLLTFAPQGEQGSTVLQVIDSGRKAPSFNISTSEGDVAVNVSAGCAILSALAGKTRKYADQVEQAFYDHLDAQLSAGTDVEFNWEERFMPFKGMVMHIATTPSCVERNGFINFCDFDVSQINYEERMGHINSTLEMFEPADENAINLYAENKKASANKKRKPQVTRS